MSIKGLCVEGMEITEISKKLVPYISEYVNGFALKEDDPLFLEGHIFSLEEISGMLPKYYLEYFTDESNFICFSGFIIVTNSQDKEEQQIISLVMDESSERAFLLCVHEENEDEGEKAIIIKDFLA